MENGEWRVESGKWRVAGSSLGYYLAERVLNADQADLAEKAGSEIASDPVLSARSALPAFKRSRSFVYLLVFLIFGFFWSSTKGIC